MPTAVEEVLRFESPLQLNNRVTTAPIEIGGRSFPAGTFLTLGVGAANRDPAQFPSLTGSTSAVSRTATSCSATATTPAPG